MSTDWYEEDRPSTAGNTGESMHDFEGEEDFHLHPSPRNLTEDDADTISKLSESVATEDATPRANVSPRPMLLDTPDPDNYELRVVSDIPLFAASLERPKGKYETIIGNAKTTVIPSYLGRPADSERLFMMFLTSQFVQVQADQRHENYWLAFRPSDYKTWRGITDAGTLYKSLKATLECLSTTQYHTNIRLAESYKQIEDEATRAQYNRDKKHRTTGLVFELDEEGRPRKGVVDAGSYSLIDQWWYLGEKLIGNEVIRSLNDYVLLKMPINVFMHLASTTARLKAHDDITSIRSAQIRALTQFARSYCGTQRSVKLRNEAAVLALLQLASSPDAAGFDLKSTRKNLRKFCNTQPLLDYAFWYGPKPIRRKASPRDDEWMFYFLYDETGKYRKEWAEVKKKRGRNAIPQEILAAYPTASQ